jgi:hypothetical protein
VAKWMVREGPYIRVVGELESVDGVGQERIEAPVHDGSVRAAGHEVVVMDRVPCKGCHRGRDPVSVNLDRLCMLGNEPSQRTANFFFVTSKRVQLLHGPDVIHLEKRIARCRSHRVAVWVPRERLDRVLVAVPDRSHLLERKKGQDSHGQARTETEGPLSSVGPKT